MTEIAAAAFGVLGTLLGSMMTYLFQQRSARATEEFQRDSTRAAEQSARLVRLREERLAAFSDYLGKLSHYRQAEMDWWWRRTGGPGGEGGRNVMNEARDRRASAWESLFSVQLLNDDRQVRESELITEIHDATDDEDFNTVRRQSLDEIKRFTDIAAESVVTPSVPDRNVDRIHHRPAT